MITNQTIRADGKTVAQAKQEDTEALAGKLPFPVANYDPLDERREQFKNKVRDAVLGALDYAVIETFGSDRSGWKDEELPNLFKALDAHSVKVFNRMI
jgi:hypothetical protein